jgi:hypothetical protein
MTETTTDTFMTDLTSWIDEAAVKLRWNLHDNYTSGYECGLAVDIAKRITTPGQREAALRSFITEDLMQWPVTGGALDEGAAETYALMTDIARRIADLSWRQMQAEGTDLRFRRMIADQICKKQRALAFI